jgi:hypothetical protein
VRSVNACMGLFSGGLYGPNQLACGVAVNTGASILSVLQRGNCSTFATAAQQQQHAATTVALGTERELHSNKRELHSNERESHNGCLI